MRLRTLRKKRTALLSVKALDKSWIDWPEHRAPRAQPSKGVYLGVRWREVMRNYSAVWFDPPTHTRYIKASGMWSAQTVRVDLHTSSNPRDVRERVEERIRARVQQEFK